MLAPPPLCTPLRTFLADPKTLAWMTSNLDEFFGFPSVVRFSWGPSKKRIADGCITVDWFVWSRFPVVVVGVFFRIISCRLLSWKEGFPRPHGAAMFEIRQDNLPLCMLPPISLGLQGATTMRRVMRARSASPTFSRPPPNRPSGSGPSTSTAECWRWRRISEFLIRIPRWRRVPPGSRLCSLLVK